MAWGLLDRFRSKAPIGQDVSASKLAEDVSDFELPDDASSLSSKASSVFSNDGDAASVSSASTASSAFSTIRRLGANLGLSESTAKAPTIEFDAADFLDSEHENSDHVIASDIAPTQNGKHGRTTGLRHVSASVRTPAVPTKSALTFLGKIQEVGIKAAIANEVQARQDERINAFVSDLKNGINPIQAIRNAEEFVTDRGRGGRQQKVDAAALAKSFRSGMSKEEFSKAVGSILTDIQNHHYQGASKSNLNSNEIVVNFENNRKNGSNLEAAGLALAYIEAGHDYIRANDQNGNNHSREGIKQLGASSPRSPSPPSSSRYDDRTDRDRVEAR